MLKGQSDTDKLEAS